MKRNFGKDGGTAEYYIVVHYKYTAVSTYCGTVA